jgi:hypothetical protein
MAEHFLRAAFPLTPPRADELRLISSRPGFMVRHCVLGCVGARLGRMAHIHPAYPYFNREVTKRGILREPSCTN